MDISALSPGRCDTSPINGGELRDPADGYEKRREHLT